LLWPRDSNQHLCLEGHGKTTGRIRAFLLGFLVVLREHRGDILIRDIAHSKPQVNATMGVELRAHDAWLRVPIIELTDVRKPKSVSLPSRIHRLTLQCVVDRVR
jgi:hypothetical protein